jgi:hypothetical protein
MKYLLISDFDSAEEADDGLYVLKARLTVGSDEEPTMELFSEGDIYKIRNNKPAEADAISLQDDWMFYNSSSNALLGYVFKD